MFGAGTAMMLCIQCNVATSLRVLNLGSTGKETRRMSTFESALTSKILLKAPCVRKATSTEDDGKRDVSVRCMSIMSGSELHVGSRSKVFCSQVRPSKRYSILSPLEADKLSTQE